MKLLHKKELSELGVTFYFLATPHGVDSDGDVDADGSLWSHRGAVLQLRYDHGAKEDADLLINNGNMEPHRGFGHIAFNVDDVYAHCAAMERDGAAFKKRPNEGRMKGLAFAMDPNSYWIEVVRRSEHCGFKVPCNLSQTMLRIKNPEESLRFYCDLMGMRLITESLDFAIKQRLKMMHSLLCHGATQSTLKRASFHCISCRRLWTRSISTLYRMRSGMS